MPLIILFLKFHYINAYMQKAGDCWDISPQFFLDFPQNFRLRTRNQYFFSHFFVDFHNLRTFSTILDGGSTILDGGSTTLDGSSTIFCRFSPFFINFHDLHTFVAIYILSRFTHFFCKFFLAKIAFSATSHVFCKYVLLIKRSWDGLDFWRRERRSSWERTIPQEFWRGDWGGGCADAAGNSDCTRVLITIRSTTENLLWGKIESKRVQLLHDHVTLQAKHDETFAPAATICRPRDLGVP